jgi:hypothetical protein
MVAFRGAPAPEAVGGRYRRITSASVNDTGVVVFTADLAGSASASAIISIADGRCTVLARSGEPAPGGGRYDSFGELDLGDDGSLLYQASLAGCEATEGVFLRTASGTRAVGRAGEGTGIASFERLTLTSYLLPSGPYFRLAYLAHLADARTSLVVWPSYRDPRTVFTTGDTIAGGVLEDFTISRQAFAVCVIAHIRRDTGSRRVALLASDEHIVWGHRLRDGGRLPEVGRISRLCGPAGMYVHHGFVAVELDDGGTALVTRCAGTDPESFARSGVPVPDLPDRHIARFEPPVANHGLPEGGPCGVASVARLDDARSALWLGVFLGQQPMMGAAITPLVTGDYTDDDPAVRVDAFAPIKLTNTGTLLLRATADASGRPADGLLVLENLFDWHRPS